AMPCALQPRKFIMVYCSSFFAISKGDRFPPISNFITFCSGFGRVPNVFMFGTVVGLLGLTSGLGGHRGARDENRLSIACASATFAWLALPAEAAKTYQYSDRVQHACANDYRGHCGEYGIETSALRLCMNKAGQQLSHGCVNALVADGQISRAEVERRKRTGR